MEKYNRTQSLKEQFVTRIPPKVIISAKNTHFKEDSPAKFPQATPIMLKNLQQHLMI